jgi:uncharacterized DUF497 family protein
VRITFDQAKRDKTLKARGLDFRRAREVFATTHLTRADDRHEYGEPRFITAGRSMIEWSSSSGLRAAVPDVSSR